MKKISLALAISTIAAGRALAAESIAPTTSPANETPTYLKQEKPVLLAQSPVLTAKGLGSQNFNVELNARFKEVRLVVTDGGNGIASDHADWVNAGFVIPANENE